MCNCPRYYLGYLIVHLMGFSLPTFKNMVKLIMHVNVFAVSQVADFKQLKCQMNESSRCHY